MKKLFISVLFVIMLIFCMCLSGYALASEYAPRKFIVGTAATSLPYTYMADDGTWSGAEADFWDEIRRRTGWDIQVKRCADISTMFGELDSGRIDVAANCLAITPSCLEAHIASDPI